MAEKADSRRRRPTTGATKILLGITALGVLVFLVCVGLIIFMATREESAEVVEGSFLRVELSGVVPDAPLQGGFFLEPEDAPVITADITRAIRAAADDERIAGLYLELDEPLMGIGRTQEVRDALAAFTESGKPCVAYSTSYGDGAYYLASACDQVLLAPSGVFLANGLAISITYYAGTFEKIGVEPDFEWVGDYKSAIEPYELTGPSEAAAEAYNTLLDSLWEQILAGVAAGRGLEVEQLSGLIDAFPMAPSQAVERGLVDGLAFPDAIEHHIRAVGEEGWTELLSEPIPQPEEGEEEEDEADRFTDLHEYLVEVRKDDKRADKRIAVIHAEGQIVSGSGETGLFGGSVLADEPFEEWMEQVREDEDIAAVVLRVNSPGGSGLASDMMWRQIELVGEAGKPVVVSMADYAASGGYYIACNSDWIVAQPGTLTGSIGVYGGKLAVAGTYDKVGLSEHVFKRGELADMLSMTQPFSDDGRQVFRAFLENFYDQFLGKVAAGRGMERDAVHAVAQGRVWTGSQALEHGLVDQLGGLDEAIAKAAELAELEEYGTVRLPEEKDLFEMLMEDLASASEPTITVPWVSEPLEEVWMLDRILADNGVAAHLPGNPRID